MWRPTHANRQTDTQLDSIILDNFFVRQLFLNRTLIWRKSSKCRGASPTSWVTGAICYTTGRNRTLQTYMKTKVFSGGPIWTHMGPWQTQDRFDSAHIKSIFQKFFDQESMMITESSFFLLKFYSLIVTLVSAHFRIFEFHCSLQTK